MSCHSYDPNRNYNTIYTTCRNDAELELYVVAWHMDVRVNQQSGKYKTGLLVKLRSSYQETNTALRAIEMTVSTTYVSIPQNRDSEKHISQAHRRKSKAATRTQTGKHGAEHEK
eukprot:gene6620-327_t